MPLQPRPEDVPQRRRGARRIFVISTEARNHSIFACFAPLREIVSAYWQQSGSVEKDVVKRLT
jgi:hypothetical protein